MNYKYFTTFQRSRIEVRNNLGYSRRYIAKLIGKHHSTIARDYLETVIIMKLKKQMLTIVYAALSLNPKENTVMKLVMRYKFVIKNLFSRADC